jgi:hypothetical protein
MSDKKEKKTAMAANFTHNATCPKCDSLYDSNTYGKGLCGTCERIGQTRKRNKTDGERDLVDFMECNMGFQMKLSHPDYYKKGA